MRQEINKLNEEQIDDKKQHLPYCWAVILETLRYIPQVRDHPLKTSANFRDFDHSPPHVCNRLHFSKMPHPLKKRRRHLANCVLVNFIIQEVLQIAQLLPLVIFVSVSFVRGLRENLKH